MERKENEESRLSAVESRLQFDTLVQLQMEEREKIRKHYGKIIVALVTSLILLIAIIFGSVVYVFTNFEFDTEPTSYTQDGEYVYGDFTIEDGIHVKEN